MSEYLKLLVLSYFKNHVIEYSLEDLRYMTGVTTLQLNDLIDEMFADGLLQYENYKMILTFKGRMILMNSAMEEYYDNNCNIDELFFEEKWPLDKPFLVHGFSKLKWRDSQ